MTNIIPFPGTEDSYHRNADRTDELFLIINENIEQLLWKNKTEKETVADFYPVPLMFAFEDLSYTLSIIISDLLHKSDFIDKSKIKIFCESFVNNLKQLSPNHALWLNDEDFVDL